MVARGAVLYASAVPLPGYDTRVLALERSGGGAQGSGGRCGMCCGVYLVHLDVFPQHSFLRRHRRVRDLYGSSATQAQIAVDGACGGNRRSGNSVACGFGASHEQPRPGGGAGSRRAWRTDRRPGPRAPALLHALASAESQQWLLRHGHVWVRGHGDQRRTAGVVCRARVLGPDCHTDLSDRVSPSAVYVLRIPVLRGRVVVCDGRSGGVASEAETGPEPPVWFLDTPIGGGARARIRHSAGLVGSIASGGRTGYGVGRASDACAAASAMAGALCLR